MNSKKKKIFSKKRTNVKKNAVITTLHVEIQLHRNLIIKNSSQVEIHYDGCIYIFTSLFCFEELVFNLQYEMSFVQHTSRCFKLIEFM